MNRSDWISFLLVFTVLVVCASFPIRIEARGQGSARTMPGLPAVKTTLCELEAAPERFQGKIVEVRATIQTGFQTSLLRDDTCSTFIWLSGLDTAQPGAGEGSATALRKDREFQKMQDYLTRKYKPKNGVICSNCPLYRVTATVVGRFEYVRKGDSGPGTGAAAGFGYLNSYESQLVLLGVSNVTAETIDRSANAAR